MQRSTLEMLLLLAFIVDNFLTNGMDNRSIGWKFMNSDNKLSLEKPIETILWRRIAAIVK